MLRHVDLCSGIGGFSLGFQWAELSKPVLFCDIEPWSRQILAKHWPDVPIAEDVKELANDPDGLVPDCDILTAGYPCQPFSVAGDRKGAEDDRHIWPYIFSIIQAKRPTFCIFENVLGHVTLGLDEVLSDLENESYTTRPFIVPACATDAPHQRNRLWIIAHILADTSRKRLQGRLSGRQNKERKSQLGYVGCSSTIHRQPIQNGWAAEPSVGRVAHGIPDWMDEPRDIPRVSKGVPNRANRLKGLGNAIVPQISMKIAESILKEMQPDSKK